MRLFFWMIIFIALGIAAVTIYVGRQDDELGYWYGRGASTALLATAAAGLWTCLTARVD